MRKWKTLEVEGQFRIDCPSAATYRMEDEDTSFVIRFPGSEATDLWIARFPVNRDHPEFKATFKRLEHLVRHFLTTSVRKTIGKVPWYSIERAVDADPKWSVAQGLGIVKDGDRWLVRAVAGRGWPEFFLLHWNGPEKTLKSLVIRSFVSFSPLWKPSSDVS